MSSLNPFAKVFEPRKKKASYADIAAKEEIKKEIVVSDRNRLDTSNWYVLSKNANMVPEIKSSDDDINCKLFVTKVDVSSKMSDYWCQITSKCKPLSSYVPVRDTTNNDDNNDNNDNNDSSNNKTHKTTLWHGILQSNIKYSNNILNSTIEIKNSGHVSCHDIIDIDALQIFNKIRANDSKFVTSLICSESALTIIDPVSSLDLITFLCTFNKIEMLKMVLSLDIGNMKKINYNKATLITLLQVAASSSDIEVFKSVMKLGDITMKCGNKENILHKAVKANNINLMKYLLISKESSNKININCKNKQGETPLFCVKSREAIIVLMNYGANPYIINDENDNVFGKLVRVNKYSLLNSLLATNSNNNYYKQFETMKVNNPLNIASKFGFIDCIKILLQSDRYDINARDYYTSDTPLLCACRNYQKDTIKCLLSMNADPFIECSDGFPPLILVFNDVSIINIFLDHENVVDWYSNDATFTMKLLKYVIHAFDFDLVNNNGNCKASSISICSIISYYIAAFRLIVPKKALYFLIKNANKSKSMETLQILTSENIFDNTTVIKHDISGNNSNENGFDILMEGITICSIGFNSTLLYSVSTVFAMLVNNKIVNQVFDGIIYTSYDQKYLIMFKKWLYNSYLSHDKGKSEDVLLNLSGDDIIELLHFSNEFIIESLHHDCQVAFIKNDYYSNMEVEVMHNLIASLNLDLIKSYYFDNHSVNVFDCLDSFIASTGKACYKNINFQCTDALNGDINGNGTHYDLLLVSRDDKFIYCHKVILYNFSQKFRGMIKFHDGNLESSILKLQSSSTVDELSMLLEWMYFGQINTENKTHLCRLLLLADEYIITTLSTRLEILLLEIIPDNLEMIVEVLHIAQSIDTSGFERLCVVSAYYYVNKYKNILNQYDIASNQNCADNEDLLHDALQLLIM